ncbi:hypothetical protein GCM10010166_53700 [Couchioplanes caeruleus subsp. azureus]|nr:hypothetical protein GCM10010166_53700 [Couchioplanes caeruleus subsp. azureus]
MRDDRGAATQLDRAVVLCEEVARLAGAIADTEEQVAAVRRQMAALDPGRAGEHLAAAAAAERFAAHERREQSRWRVGGETGGRGPR